MERNNNSSSGSRDHWVGALEIYHETADEDFLSNGPGFN